MVNGWDGHDESGSASESNAEVLMSVESEVSAAVLVELQRPYDPGVISDACNVKEQRGGVRRLVEHALHGCIVIDRVVIFLAPASYIAESRDRTRSAASCGTPKFNFVPESVSLSPCPPSSLLSEPPSPSSIPTTVSTCYVHTNVVNPSKNKSANGNTECTLKVPVESEGTHQEGRDSPHGRPDTRTWVHHRSVTYPNNAYTYEDRPHVGTYLIELTTAGKSTAKCIGSMLPVPFTFEQSTTGVDPESTVKVVISTLEYVSTVELLVVAYEHVVGLERSPANSKWNVIIRPIMVPSRGCRMRQRKGQSSIYTNEETMC